MRARQRLKRRPAISLALVQEWQLATGRRGRGYLIPLEIFICQIRGTTPDLRPPNVAPVMMRPTCCPSQASTDIGIKRGGSGAGRSKGPPQGPGEAVGQPAALAKPS
jgi:hypothetical protein